MIVRRITLILLFLFVFTPLSTLADTVAYGNNPEAGEYADVNGIKMYYETYGKGPPLLLIHGNGQSIAEMHFQVEYFSRDYQVIVGDSRAHGKTVAGPPPLNYVQMMEDYNALLEQMGIDAAYVFGWSDGGIMALLLAIQHPDKVGKIAVMGANLRPDESAINPWVGEMLQPMSDSVDEMIASGDTSDDWQLHRQMLDLLMNQPDISLASLQQIKVPVLVIAGDMDIIRAQHTLEIFSNLPNAHLAILPGQTHWAPATDPDGFNAVVGKFFKTPFTRPTSEEILRAELYPPEG